MLPPHLRKFSDLYASYGLGAVKNVWLLTCLIPIARTVNLYKIKDYVGAVLDKPDTQTRWPASYQQCQTLKPMRSREAFFSLVHPICVGYADNSKASYYIS